MGRAEKECEEVYRQERVEAKRAEEKKTTPSHTSLAAHFNHLSQRAFCLDAPQRSSVIFFFRSISFSLI